MAINKVVAPNSVPTNVSDYVAQNAHMMGFMTQVNMQAFVLTDPTTADKPKIALGSYIAHGGSLYKVESGDETISGSPADGKVYVRVTGSATLSASFISDISGYSYNHAYGTMTSGAYTLLPYEIRKSGSNWVKYRYDFLGTTDQDLRTTDSPKFNTIKADGEITSGAITSSGAIKGTTIDTGQGAVEAYAMNQAVRTTDNVTFARVGVNSVPVLQTVTGSPLGDITLNSMSVGALVEIKVNISLTSTGSSIHRTVFAPAGRFFAVLYSVSLDISPNKTTVGEAVIKGGDLVIKVTATNGSLASASGSIYIWRIA